MDERTAREGLSCCVEPGCVAAAVLVAEHGAVETWRRLRAGALGTGAAARSDRFPDPEVRALAARHGVRFVIPGDSEWPARLGDLDHAEQVQQLGGQPFGLWLRGNADLAAVVERSVAVVGSRAATPYGETTAAELAGDLAALGVAVISGGAFGIDAAAHRGALAAGGATVAVMAGGLDSVYPAANTELLHRVARSACLVSELPPGARPTRVRFLARNRLIAALAPATVLVEAAERSGARNTITWANACHRIALAVPGPVHSATSVTPHRLIRGAEATLVTCAADVLEALGPLGGRTGVRPPQVRPLDRLSSEELAVYEALPGRTSLDAGEISLRSGLPLRMCLGILEGLCAEGLLEQTTLGWRLRRP